MNEAQAKAKVGELGRKYPDTTHKGWEARKAFAKECGIDVKVFNKGLGPQYSRLAGFIKGVKEVNALVPVDDRSFKAFPAEKAKLDRIIKAYQGIVTPNLRIDKGVQYYGWWALDQGLKDMQAWADGVAKQAKELAAKRGR